jgi:hypothetical protein
MDVGSLFFSLGFKSKGTAELKNYESAIDGAMSAAEAMQDTFNAMLNVLEKMAVKMGAVTEEEIKKHKEDAKILKVQKDLAPVEEKSNKTKQKQAGLMGMVHQKLVGLVGRFNAYRLELIGTSSALIYFVNKMSALVIQFDKLASATGISMDTMQRISAMAGEAGTSVDDLGGAVQRLQEQSIDIMLGKGDISPYAFLGLSPHQDPLKILEQVQAKLKSMPTALGTKAARDLGLSEDLIYFLRNAENIKPPPEETLLTEAEMKRLKEFNFYFNRVFEQARRVMSKFGAGIAPFVTLLLYAFDRMGRMFGDFINKLEPYQDKILIFMKALAVMVGVVAAILFPWTAAFVALLAVLEDIYSYVKGEKSVFGSMVEWFKQIGQWIDDTIIKMMKFLSLFTSGPIASLTSKFAEWFTPNAPATGGGQAGGAVTNNNNITVDGAKNPAEVAKAITDHITRTTSDAYYQFAPGGF